MFWKVHSPTVECLRDVCTSYARGKCFIQTLSLLEDNISLSQGYNVPSSANAAGVKHGPQHTKALIA